jgi:hypothetical protein
LSQRRERREALDEFWCLIRVPCERRTMGEEEKGYPIRFLSMFSFGAKVDEERNNLPESALSEDVQRGILGNFQT